MEVWTIIALFGEWFLLACILNSGRIGKLQNGDKVVRSQSARALGEAPLELAF